MKFRNCILLCIAAVMLFSCNRKKENNENTQQGAEQTVRMDGSFLKAEAKKISGSDKYTALDDEMRELIKPKVTATEEEKKI